MVYSLLALGLLIVIMLPFLIVASVTAAGSEEFTSTGQIAVWVGATIGSIIVLPITYIPATLLYYDLRVRKRDTTCRDSPRDGVRASLKKVISE